MSVALRAKRIVFSVNDAIWLSGYPGILAIGNTPIKFNISILVAVTIRKTTLVGT